MVDDQMSVDFKMKKNSFGSTIYYVKNKFFYLAHSLLSSISGSKGDKCVASVEAGHGVHHEPEIPNGATFFKQWYQLTLVHIARNFATKDLRKKEKN